MLTGVEWRILRWTAVHRGLTLALLIVAALLQSPFDSSAWLQLRLDASATPLATLFALPLLKWDALHFLAIASPRALPLPPPNLHVGQTPNEAGWGGVQSEQSFAFQPGIVWLLRIMGHQRGDRLSWNPSQSILLTSTLATMMSILQPLMLFSLTKNLTGREKFSQVAAYLCILSPSPSTLITPTPESFFSFLALLGHLFVVPHKGRHQLLRLFMASTCYAMATAFRANGILLVGFPVWQAFWKPRRQMSRLSAILAPIMVIYCLMPFILSQGFAYVRFCSREVDRKEWCSRMIPSLYNHVQDHYWNVGPLRYWTLAQVPNWIIAFPILGFIFYWLSTFYRENASLVVRKTLTPWREDQVDSDLLVAHAHFAFITFLVLVFTSHVQIALRFASPGGLPALWWGASHLVFRMQRKNIAWLGGASCTCVLVTYLVVWNLSSTILYAGFYPPA
ncbi:hypothetical protein CBS101457_000464 [Exobasidium rhododendri]|nr:hypothetical protein CBS101457_000464 [Exobasidium rhododendri]